MHFTRPHLQRTTWIALFAMLWLALAPMASHLAAAGRDAPWQEICSALGQDSAAADRSTRRSDGPGSALLSNLGHCPLCALQAHLALPPAPLGVLAGVELSAAAPLLFLSAPRTLYAWRHALSRGPPSSF